MAVRADMITISVQRTNEAMARAGSYIIPRLVVIDLGDNLVRQLLYTH